MPLELPDYKTIVDLFKAGMTLEAQEKVMTLREAALELRADNLELKQQVADLEAALQAKGDWEMEKKRYALVVVVRSAQAFVVREEFANGETPQFLCANCFENGRKSPLNIVRPKGQMLNLVCPNCGATQDTGMNGFDAPKYAELYADRSRG